MAITIEINTRGTTRTATIDGEGAIDTQAEATAALEAAGGDADRSTFTVGGVTRSYAQLVGVMRLGTEAHRVTGVDEFFHFDGTTWDSRSNAILRDPARYDRRAAVTAPRVERTAGEALTLADEAAVRTLAGLTAEDHIQGIQFDSLPEDTTAPYEVPASAMTAGDHTLRVRYRHGSETTDRIKIVPIRLGAAPVVAPPDQTRDAARAAYGVWPTLNRNVSRPAALPGVAAGPLEIGNIEVTSAVPQGSMLAVYVDGNEVGTIALQPSSPGTDHTTSITIPAGTADGDHQVGLRIRRPGQAEVRYNDRPVTIGPATATLSAASVTSTASYYANDRISIRVTSDRATRARITVGTHTQDVDLVAGVNNITLDGAPKTWNTGGRAGRRETFQILVQPLNGTSLTGTSVTVGSVSIQRQGTGPVTPRRTGGSWSM